MRDIVSAIVIDKECDKHDYSLVKTEKFYELAETDLDLMILNDDSLIFNKLNEFSGVDAIITVGDFDFPKLSAMPFEIRRKWVHYDEFNPCEIAESIMWVMLGNLNRERINGEKLFSIFTCAFNTDDSDFFRLYESLCNQTYTNWNWFILDDSSNTHFEELISSVNDYRITVIKNVTNHGNIGFNKRTVAMMCDGDYLVEVDHDDELTTDCLHYLNEAFEKYPDSDFVYSDAMEVMNGCAINYGETWCSGEAVSCFEEVNGKKEYISKSPNITSMTIRSIHSQPNHVRCWRADFYRKINGHNVNLSVLDDMDILVRTFLYGKMTKVDKVLYIQHEGNGERGVDGTTTQSKRFKEIQRTDEYLHCLYDKDIHARILSLGIKDTVWDDEKQRSILWEKHEISEKMNNILEV